jgi:hypothetical protein
MGVITFGAIDIASALIGAIGINTLPKIFGAKSERCDSGESRLASAVSRTRVAIDAYEPIDPFEVKLVGVVNAIVKAGELYLAE